MQEAIAMDLSNHPAIMILSIAVVLSLLSEIRIGVRIPVVVWEILLGHDSRPRSYWSGKHFTRRIVGLVRSRGARGAPVHGGHGYRLRTGSWPANGTSPGWLAPVAWTGAVFGYDSLGAGIVQAR
jgi:hypothetical protein